MGRRLSRHHSLKKHPQDGTVLRMSFHYGPASLHVQGFML